MGKRKIDWPLTLCLVGAVITLVGELRGATDKQRGNTISEWFLSLPSWVKMLLSWCFGGVCAHLWQWQIGGGPDVEVQGDVNVDIHQD